MTRSHGLSEPVVDPEAYQSTNLPAKFVDSNKLTTDRGRRQFSNVDWHDHRSPADTHAGNDTTGIDKAQSTLSISSESQGGTQDKDKRPQHQTAFATQEVGRCVGEERSKEGASLVDRDDVLLDKCKVIGRHSGKVELRGEGAQSNGSPNESRVVSNHT